MNVLVPLAEGFEEIEAITIIDTLRRASIKVITASLKDTQVTGSHDITVTADTTLANAINSTYEMIILPGGMPGSKNLTEDQRIIDLVQNIYTNNGYIAAICAAPMVLGKAGIIKGKNATCFPGVEDKMTEAIPSAEPVVQDGNIITGRGPACTIPFSLKIVEIIKGKEAALKIQNAMQVYWM